MEIVKSQLKLETVPTGIPEHMFVKRVSRVAGFDVDMPSTSSNGGVYLDNATTDLVLAAMTEFGVPGAHEEGEVLPALSAESSRADLVAAVHYATKGMNSYEGV